MMRRSQYLGIGLLVAVVACIALALSAWVSMDHQPGDPNSATELAERTEWMGLFSKTADSTWTVSTFPYEPTWTPLVDPNITPEPTGTPCPAGESCPTPTEFTLPTLPDPPPTWTAGK